MTMEAETGVMQPHAEKCLEPPEAARSEDRFSPGAFRRKKLCQELDFKLSAPITRESIHFCCVKPPHRG